MRTLSRCWFFASAVLTIAITCEGAAIHAKLSNGTTEDVPKVVSDDGSSVSCASGTAHTTVFEDISKDAGPALAPAFLSLSIELASFPSFAGNKSNPNNFSKNLLANLGKLSGTMPYIRVGGSTQDAYIYDAGLKEPIRFEEAENLSGAPFSIGPSFFESYTTWPGTKFSHGFNLKNTTDSNHQSLIDVAQMACKTISSDMLNVWEYGNEPNLYSERKERPSDWDVVAYAKEWAAGSKLIDDTFAKYCPDAAGANSPGFMSPSLAGDNATSNFSAITAFQQGINVSNNIKQISSHNYIAGAKDSWITLQNTLMNHDKIKSSVGGQVSLAQSLTKSAPGIPFILGETNSLYGGGAAGLSNTFGAALWVLDFSLYCASQGITRIHFHQSEGAPYSAWNPRQNKHGPPTTLASYYGKIAVASFIGDGKDIQIVNVPRASNYEAAYAAYANGELKRIAVINMVMFNSTEKTERPKQNFEIALPGISGQATVQRLQAAGSDVLSGITFDDLSYDYAKKGGLPVKVGMLARPELITATKSGVLNIEVANSEAAIVSF